MSQWLIQHEWQSINSTMSKSRLVTSRDESRRLVVFLRPSFRDIDPVGLPPWLPTQCIFIVVVSCQWLCWGPDQTLCLMLIWEAPCNNRYSWDIMRLGINSFGEMLNEVMLSLMNHLFSGSLITMNMEYVNLIYPWSEWSDLFFHFTHRYDLIRACSGPFSGHSSTSLVPTLRRCKMSNLVKWSPKNSSVTSNCKSIMTHPNYLIRWFNVIHPDHIAPLIFRKNFASLEGAVRRSSHRLHVTQFTRNHQRNSCSVWVQIWMLDKWWIVVGYLQIFKSYGSYFTWSIHFWWSWPLALYWP